MTGPTLMVHLELEQPNEARLRVAAGLADRLNGTVIGIAASQPEPAAYISGAFAGSLVQEERARVRARIEATETAFRAAFSGRANPVEWRCSFSAPAAYIAAQSRAADLVISGTGGSGLQDPLSISDPSELVMLTGRPVLTVPPDLASFDLRRVLIAWKDAREARRAVMDALPLAKAAERVSVVALAEDEDEARVTQGAEDVAAWLRRHEVTAEARCLRASADAATQIQDIASQEQADLIVAGAYGHSRFREWVLGGVTRSLVKKGTRCSFLSH